MSEKRLSNDERGKQLRLAISRITRGRARTKETKLSIASVAREAGVSTALIHNYHSDIAEEIRDAMGRSSRAQRDAKHLDLKDERERNRELRAENLSLKDQVARLASINSVLVSDNRELKARVSDPKVSDIGSKRTGSD